MKSRAALSRRLVLLSTISGFALGGTFVNERWQQHNATIEKDRRDEIQRLARLDAELDRDLMLARFGLAPHFDHLNQTAAEFGRTLEAARSTGDSADVTATFAAIAASADQRLRLIEAVKSKRAEVQNSSHALPGALAALTAHPNAEQARQLHDLVLAVALTPTAENYAVLVKLTDDLTATGALPPSDPLFISARHARELADKQQLDLKTEAAVNQATGLEIGKLRTAFDNERQRQSEAGARTRTLLAIVSVLLVLGVAFALRRLSLLNASARRFVPYEFLEMLGKDSLADIERGDAVEKEMSVVFADIRDFTARSAKRTPHENFKFMNEYLGAMEGPIHAHGGFVNQYLGDGIMALFPRSADDALRAAQGMFGALGDLNKKLGDDAVRIGIGINTGSLMLGTLGGRDRMNAGVISDAVNLAARMEGLTKHYGARLLISEHTRSRASSSTAFSQRLVDRVLVKGGQRPVNVYQVVDVEEVPRRDQLKKAIEQNDSAFDVFYARRFGEARGLFEQILATVPGDVVAAQMIARCEQFDREPPPATWDGALRLDVK